MDNMIGKRIQISGMAIEVVADADESWECLNVTTKETVFIKKAVLNNAIKLGKAELLADPGDV